MKKTIKKYLNETIPESNIDSIYGKYYIRFELGGEVFDNGTPERVDQAVKRAIEIYNQTIGTDEIIIIIEEFINELYDSGNKHKKYLYSLINENNLKRIKGPFEQTYHEEDENGEKVEKIAEDKFYCDLLFGKINLELKTAQEIIKGIINLEMGFKPCVPQNIYFYSIKKGTGMNIYDDRGCDIWAKDKEQLRNIYHNLNSWILDYNRPEIDLIFK